MYSKYFECYFKNYEFLEKFSKNQENIFKILEKI